MTSQESSQQATADIGTNEVAHVYAEALLNAAEKQNSGQEVLDELGSLVHDIFDQQPRLEEIFQDRSVSRENKTVLIRDLFQDRASALFQNFLHVLNDHDRLGQIRDVLAEATAIWNQQQNRIQVTARSAVPLPEDQLEKLKNQLRESFQKEPLIDVEVDPDLLGGLVVQVGDWLFDGSTRSRLERIHNYLIESSSHELEDRRDQFGTFESDN